MTPIECSQEFVKTVVEPKDVKHRRVPKHEHQCHSHEVIYEIFSHFQEDVMYWTMTLTWIITETNQYTGVILSEKTKDEPPRTKGGTN